MADVPLLIAAGSPSREHAIKDDVLVFTTQPNRTFIAERKSHSLTTTRNLITELKQAYAQNHHSDAGAESSWWTLERVEGAEQELLLTRFSNPVGDLSMQTDSIRIKIETDGTIKLVTDEISLANHATAEDVIQQIISHSQAAHSKAVGARHTHHHHHQAGRTSSPLSEVIMLNAQSAFSSLWSNAFCLMLTYRKLGIHTTDGQRLVFPLIRNPVVSV